MRPLARRKGRNPKGAFLKPSSARPRGTKRPRLLRWACVLPASPFSLSLGQACVTASALRSKEGSRDGAAGKPGETPFEPRLKPTDSLAITRLRFLALVGHEPEAF